jgi:TRAP-type mannitol/chloroaromatic compound transport system substrate-binding protein
MKDRLKVVIRSISLVVAATTVMFFGFQPAGVAHAKVYHLKIQSSFPRGDMSMSTLKVFAQSAYKRSHGQLKIEVFASPEIVPGEQTFQAVRHGALDMTQSCGLYWSGFMPVGNVEFGLPDTFTFPRGTSFVQQAKAVHDFFYKSGFIKLLRKQYAKHGLYYLGIHTYGPVPFVVATSPLKTLAEIKGKKMRADGIDCQYHAGVGFSITTLDGGQAYMALKLGTIDASEWDVSCITGMHWNEVAPYWIRGMENDQTIGHILVNLQEWNSFPPEIKAALKGAANDYWNATVKVYGHQLQIVHKLIKEGKLHEVWVNKNVQNKYQEVAQKIWKNQAKQSPVVAKAIKMVLQWKDAHWQK